jgi:uncharacterized protein (DUF58 family)
MRTLRLIALIRLTRRGMAVLGGAVALFAVGVLAGYPVLLGLSGAALGAVGAASASTIRRPNVSVSRDVYPDRVQRGRPAFARLRVHNTSRRRQAAFTARDPVGVSMQAVVVRPLSPGADAVYHYDLPSMPRGRHPVGPLRLDRVDPLGLGRSRLTAGDTATLWVHPRCHPMRAISGGHPRHHHEGRTSTLTGSTDLREVREYAPGDEVRHLHWKATARTGRLMVRVYDDPNQPRFTTLLDTRRAGAVFEEAVDLAASLVVSATGAGHRCRLVTACGVDLAVTGGTASVRPMLDELSLLGPATGTGLPLVPGPLSRSGGGSIAVVLAGITDDDRTALSVLRRRFPTMVVILLGSPGIAVPGATVLHAADAADAARQWNAAIAA